MDQFNVETEFEGKTYHGCATIEHGMVTVSFPKTGGKKSAKIYTEYKVLAKLLLDELVRETKLEGNEHLL